MAIQDKPRLTSICNFLSKTNMDVHVRSPYELWLEKLLIFFLTGKMCTVVISPQNGKKGWYTADTSYGGSRCNKTQT